ncbi:hypothetical protein AS159_07500 [Thermotoga sp. Ku-13t]|uniref:restriction endonuclease n=1 Tax=Thermotoga sp. Ku-13t TaxID=1755813 RepID=UPI0013EBBC5F|nr:restriction endonuclease [Thermotoga sp. Ku-13t]KAF2957504.1 hypothetical protein AS159_07500 [Thermotoga sp. Ku-13t]
MLQFVVFVSLTLFFLMVLIKRRNARKKIRTGFVENGQQFEAYLCEIFRRAGYRVHPTKLSHDFGADLLIENNGKLVVLQAKYYNKPIDTSAVEEAVVAGAIYGTGFVGIVTNNEIPERVKEFARQFEGKTFVRKFYLIDGPTLERLRRKERII